MGGLAGRLATMLFAGLAMLAGGLVAAPAIAGPRAAISAEMALVPNEQLRVTYRLARPVTALHFALHLGGYRAEDWHAEAADVRWIDEGDGQRIERADGQRFDRISFLIPRRYRALPKSYAPFSPFSEGSLLIHSGQFHACTTAPCDGAGPLPVSVEARGRTIGVDGRRVAGRTRFISREDGTNIFVGTLKPVAANGFVAIIDPGLPAGERDHLARSLPRAMRDFAAIYGPLSYRPELYVSIDARPRADGHISTQGGTLPRQIFMHFDGPWARGRADKDSFWLDWFFAHEAAHLFQQDKSAGAFGDDKIAWVHEGGADAMAALDVAAQGEAERRYVSQRTGEAQTACSAGLADFPLNQATAAGKFDLHYQCGLLIWLALDGDLRRAGHDGLHTLNRALFKRVTGGAPWDQSTFLAVARDLGALDMLIARIDRMTRGGYRDATAEVAAPRALATPVDAAARR